MYSYSIMPMQAYDRECFAGWTLGADGTAYDFQGRCVPGGGGASGQYSARVCLNPYFTNGQTYYDSKGYCDPTKTQLPGGQIGIPGGNYGWLWYVAAGVGGYLVWKYRKKIF